MTKIATILILSACLYVLYVPNIPLYEQKAEVNQEII
jgi:hypothetical protein